MLVVVSTLFEQGMLLHPAAYYDKLIKSNWLPEVLEAIREGRL